MKKLIYLLVAIVVLGLIVSGCIPVVPPAEKDEATILTKAPKVKPPSGAHYNLNIIGKKSDWNAQGSFDNPDRHTMFVPENTDEFTLESSHCYTPSGTPSWAPEGANYHDPRNEYPGITIWMTQYPNGTGENEFAVLDGNAFDDCKCEFQLPSGKYSVWIVAKAKPGDDYLTNITGWIRYEDYDYLPIGNVTVKKKDGWQDATHIFEVDFGEDIFKFSWTTTPIYPVWVFDYMAKMESELSLTDTEYFWQYDNKGNKLVKVRFYPD